MLTKIGQKLGYRSLELRANPGRYDRLDYDNENDNDDGVI
jgi:hypothetical protein